MVLTRHLNTQDNMAIEGLQNDLIAEWRTPHANNEPIIIQEEGPGGRPFRLYVVWSAWRDLSQMERSGIIMRAAEAVGGRDLAMQITLAMGLTASEAKKMGIELT